MRLGYKKLETDKKYIDYLKTRYKIVKENKKSIVFSVPVYECINNINCYCCDEKLKHGKIRKEP